MTQTRTDIIARLRSAIAAWKAEVTAAQAGLARQIAGTCDQLRRMLDLFAQRAPQEASLAAAQDEIERLRAALAALNLPPAAITRYLPDTSPRLEAVQQDLTGTLERLEVNVGLWRAEVTQAQEALARQIRLANEQFETLLAMLDHAAQEPLSEHLEAPLEALIQRNQNTIRALRREKAELVTRNDDLEAALRKAGEDAAAQARTIEYLQADLEESRERCAELTEQRDYGVRHMKELEQTVTALRMEIENAREKESDTTQQIKAQAERIRVLEERLAAMKEQAAAAASQQNRLLQERAVLRRNTDAALAENAELRAARDQHEAAARTLEQALAEARETLAAQTLSLRDRDGKIAALQARIAALTAEMETLRDKEEEARIVARESREALYTMQQTEEDRTRIIAEYRAELRSLAEQLAEEKTRADALETHRGELAALLEEIRAREAESAAAVDTLQKENAALREQTRERARQWQEAQAALAAQSAAIAKRDAAIQRLNHEIAALRRTATGIPEAADVKQSENAARQLPRKRISMGMADDSRTSNGHDAEALRIQQRILIAEAAHGGGRRPLGEMLKHAGVITDAQLHEALKQQRHTPDELLGTILTQREFTSEDAIAQALACQLGLPLIHPTPEIIDMEAVAMLNKDLCTWRVCIPISVTHNSIVVAMANPLDEGARKKIQDITRRKVFPMIATPAAILTAIDDLYGAF